MLVASRIKTPEKPVIQDMVRDLLKVAGYCS